MVSPPFHVSVVLHLLLQWDGLVPGLWPLLLLLCVGLLWGLCCAVLSPWPMVAPSPSLVSRRVSSFGVCSDLGWYAAVLPGFLPSFGGELSFPCPGCFRLAIPTVWLSRLLEFFLNSFLGFFPLASSFC